MKPLKRALIFYSTNKFRNIAILAGMFLGIFLTSSLQRENESILDIAQHKSSKSDVQSTNVGISNSQEISTKYHNFLASYFLQESTVKRTAKKREERESVFSNLKDVHNIIGSRSWSIF